MQPLTKITATALPVEGVNIDTDRLMPARFLRKPRNENNNYQQWLFHDLRFNESGEVIDDFVLNQERYKNAQILVADSNFGCGSSREGAVYALVDNSFRVVIAPSFGEIFAANCVRNGVAPLRVSVSDAANLRQALTYSDQPQLTVDLEQCTIVPDSSFTDTASITFELDSFSRQCLLQGLDEITLTLQQSAAIETYESLRREQQPWLFANGSNNPDR